MYFTPSDRIFDTLIDTTKTRVSMIRTKFYIRKEYHYNNECPIYVSLNRAGYKRERFSLDLWINPIFWDEKVSFISNHHLANDKKLILDNIKSKFVSITTNYRLQNLSLTPEILRLEYENKLNRVNFIAFFDYALKMDSKLKDGSINRHKSVLVKLREYQPYIAFSEINIAWLDAYRHHLKFEKKNVDTTIAANFASIKKFLGLAVENGIKLTFDVKKIKPGSTRGNRNYLTTHEVKKCLKYFFSEFITPQKRICLGYFLFSCMNGMRISNVMALRRREVENSEVTIIIVKSDCDKTITLNKTAQLLISFEEQLFETKYSYQYINREIKEIMILLGITKKVSFHVARHTFATLFLKAGGKVENLQKLLGHSCITETMIYSHIIEAEANKEMFFLDDLLM